eukprot:3670890-Alexandrium_andersonii.AAC.1
MAAVAGPGGSTGGLRPGDVPWRRAKGRRARSAAGRRAARGRCAIEGAGGTPESRPCDRAPAPRSRHQGGSPASAASPTGLPCTAAKG